MTTVHCKDCKREIPLEEAYHVHPKGFRCKGCHRSHTGLIVGIVAAVVVVTLLIALAGNS